MKYLSILMIALILTLTMMSVIEVFAQQDMTITDCQSKCGIRVETGQVLCLGNCQIIVACRDRCVREFWTRWTGKGKKSKAVYMIIKGHRELCHFAEVPVKENCSGFSRWPGLIFKQWIVYFAPQGVREAFSQENCCSAKNS